MCKWACLQGLIDKNPVSGFELPPDPRRQAYCYTDDEVRKILTACPAVHRPIFEFAVLTGLRSGEICYLEKSDVEMNDAESTIMIRRKDGWNPKNGNERTLPLRSEAIEIVKKAIASSPGQWVFAPPPSTRGHPGRPQYRRERIRNVLKSIKQQLGITKGTVHTFRHVFCSRMANGKMDPFKLMTLMGHSGLQIVLLYYHVSTSQLAEAIKAVSFEKLLEPFEPKSLQPGTSPASS